MGFLLFYFFSLSEPTGCVRRESVCTMCERTNERKKTPNTFTWLLRKRSLYKIPAATEILRIFYYPDRDSLVIIPFNKQTNQNKRKKKTLQNWETKQTPRVNLKKKKDSLCCAPPQLQRRKIVSKKNIRNKLKKNTREIFPHSFSFASSCWLFNCVQKRNKNKKKNKWEKLEKGGPRTRTGSARVLPSVVFVHMHPSFNMYVEQKSFFFLFLPLTLKKTLKLPIVLFPPQQIHLLLRRNHW